MKRTFVKGVLTGRSSRNGIDRLSSQSVMFIGSFVAYVFCDPTIVYKSEHRDLVYSKCNTYYYY